MGREGLRRVPHSTASGGFAKHFPKAPRKENTKKDKEEGEK